MGPIFHQGIRSLHWLKGGNENPKWNKNEVSRSFGMFKSILDIA